MYISSRVHLQESWYKVAVCIYHHVFICRNVDINLRYVYIITCSSDGKLISSCGMYISSPVHLLDNWYKVALRIHHQVYNWRKIHIKYRYVYIISCSSAGKLILSCCMYISLRVHLEENWYNVGVCIYHQVFICRKVDIKLRYLYIISCSSAGKLILSCGMYISSRVHLEENWYKFGVCIYHQVFICRKVDIKLWYLYIITCSSAGKLIQSSGMYISSRVHLQES